MGLAYFFIVSMILGAAVSAVIFLRAAWDIYKKPRLKILAVFPFLLAGIFAAAAFYLLAIVWREPPWHFRF